MWALPGPAITAMPWSAMISRAPAVVSPAISRSGTSLLRSAWWTSCQADALTRRALFLHTVIASLRSSQALFPRARGEGLTRSQKPKLAVAQVPGPVITLTRAPLVAFSSVNELPDSLVTHT